jgi:hypothetical protein
MDHATVAAIVREELGRSELATKVRQLQQAGAITPLRSVAFTSVVGVAGYAVDTSGLEAPDGVVVVRVVPASHWSFTWFPRNTDIVVSNAGAAQTLTMHYYVIGRA